MMTLTFRSASGVVQTAAMVAALAAPAFLPAQQSKPWERIPVPKLHDFNPQQPKRIVLKNGIVVFLQEDHELPFVSGSVLLPGGSREETDAAKIGVTDLYGEAWRTSGTAKMDGDAMDDFLEMRAAHIETAGDVDSTAVSWDSLKADSDQVFDLAMDLLFHPKFSAEKLQLAQQQLATGIVRRNDEEAGIAGREADKLVYGANGPYTRQPELATIGAVTLADLQAWHDKTLKGKLIVGISGDFDPVAMEAKVRSAFESLPQAQALPPRNDVFPGPKPGVYFIDKEDVNQSNVEIVGLGTDRHNPDVPARDPIDFLVCAAYLAQQRLRLAWRGDVIALRNDRKQVGPQVSQIHTVAANDHFALHQAIITVEIDDELAVSATSHGKDVLNPRVHGMPGFNGARIIQVIPEPDVIRHVVLDRLEGLGAIIDHFARHISESGE